MSLPRISIVTPSYNQGHYLEQTICSVLDQGYPNLEYIICDGGSKDHSVEIIKKYEKHLTFWCSEKDNGQSHAINKGFTHATGDIFAYINSDDYFFPKAFDRVAEEYQAGGRFIVGWSQYMEPNGDFRAYGWQAHRERCDWLIRNPIPQQSTFWSRDLWRDLGPFREDLHFSFDYEYWLRIYFKAGVAPWTVNQCMAVFRLHKSSKTMSGAQPFDPEDAQLRKEYGHYLTWSDRRWVEKTLRHARAHADRHAAWAALKEKKVSEARKLAWSTVTNAKTSLESWRLMYCALRGY
ncbi:MAG TPA: glycosyltransferase family 2 protein [Tepidisphaeraceae bacterium]|jgi:glycosyltransferase involved in cell wall biosynthesis